MGEKLHPKPKPLDPKLVDIQPETAPLPSLCTVLASDFPLLWPKVVGVTPDGTQIPTYTHCHMSTEHGAFGSRDSNVRILIRKIKYEIIIKLIALLETNLQDESIKSN